MAEDEENKRGSPSSSGACDGKSLSSSSHIPLFSAVRWESSPAAVSRRFMGLPALWFKERNSGEKAVTSSRLLALEVLVVDASGTSASRVGGECAEGTFTCTLFNGLPLECWDALFFAGISARVPSSVRAAAVIVGLPFELLLRILIVGAHKDTMQKVLVYLRDMKAKKKKERLQKKKNRVKALVVSRLNIVKNSGNGERGR